MILPEKRHQKHGKFPRKQTGRSKFKGAVWRENDRCWVAVAKLHGKQYYLGRYNNERDCALAYDKAVIDAYGDDAVTNKDVYGEY